MTVVGPATYKLLRNLVAPEKPVAKSYEQNVKALSDHFRPTPSEIVERCKFHSRFRKPEESVATFVSKLRCLSEFCNFGTTLEVMIRDRLVCGIKDDSIQRRLLAEPKLTYKRAVELAQGMERAAENVQELKGEKNPTASGHEVHRVSRDTTPPPRRTGATCFRCGFTGHIATNCKVSRTVGRRGTCRKPAAVGRRRFGRINLARSPSTRKERGGGGV